MHSKIANANGFSGSPLNISKEEIEYTTSGNYYGSKKALKRFRKSGLYSGKITTIDIDLTKKTSFEQLEKSIKRLTHLGKLIDVTHLVKAAKKNKDLSAEQVQVLDQILQSKNSKKKTKGRER